MKKKGKKKLVLAKDPKQAALAVIVVLVFFANSAYMIAKYIMEQNANNAVAERPVDPTGTLEPSDLSNNPASLSPNGPTSVPPGAPNGNVSQDANDIYNQTLNIQGNRPGGPSAPQNISSNTGSSDDSVDIISKTRVTKQRGKQVLISVGNSGRSNPFLPAGENFAASSLPMLSLPAPPETLSSNSEASKVMTTTISGILYDKYSPSAIINIEGADYLVKVGDIINHYRILSIGKTQVIVQLGKNTYQAGVGELLSRTNLNYNTIANLNKKFGGNNSNVSIKVRKKG